MATEISIVNVNDFKSIEDAVVHAIRLIEDDFPFDFIRSAVANLALLEETDDETLEESPESEEQ